MVRKTKEETENTKARILHAALDCFYEKGFSKTSFDDISARIGMTKGAVYWHFKDKAELLSALILMHFHQKKCRAEQSNCCTAPESLVELRCFFEGESRYIESNPELQRFIFFIMMQVEWSDTVFNKVSNSLGNIRDFHVTTVFNALTQAQKKGEIAATVNVNEVAWLIVNSWRGSLNFFVTEPDKEYSLTKNFMSGLDIVLDWLKREGK